MIDQEEKILKSLAAKEVFGWIKFSKGMLILSLIGVFFTLVLTALSIMAGTLFAGVIILPLALGLRKSIMEFNRLNQKYSLVKPNAIMEYLKRFDR